MSSAFRHWIINGFEASFRQLVAVARRKGATAEAAEDLAQEAYLRLIQAEPASVRHPRGYLFRTAANLQIDEQRRGKAAPFAHTVDIEQHAAADPAPGAEQQVMGQQELRRLRGIIDGLPPRQREVFVLNRLEGLGSAEIAERLGITRNMVDRHLRLALAYCIEHFNSRP